MGEKCVLYDRECINCGECDVCDLDPNKHCDNCGRCIDDSEEYRSLNVEDFMESNITKEQVDKLKKKFSEKEKK